MAYHPTIKSLPQLRRAIDRLIAINSSLPYLPDPMSGWLSYREEPYRTNEFKTALDLLADGYGDCEDLVDLYVAYMRRNGYKSTFGLEDQGWKDNEIMIHVVAWLLDKSGWRRIDVARLLGMR
jgi:hypothetical protein